EIRRFPIPAAAALPAERPTRTAGFIDRAPLGNHHAGAERAPQLDQAKGAAGRLLGQSESGHAQLVRGAQIDAVYLPRGGQGGEMDYAGEEDDGQGRGTQGAEHRVEL